MRIYESRQARVVGELMEVVECYQSNSLCYFLQGTVLIKSAAELKAFSPGAEDLLESVSMLR